jgi:HK97 family phage major capsid protein
MDAMADIAEQIRAFEDKRASLVAANEAIMEKAAGEGSTLDAEQEETFDNNQADVEAIDKHLKRLRAMEKTAGEKAAPVNGKSSDEGIASREGRIHVKTQEKLEPGIAFARLVKALGMAKGDMGRAHRIASERYGEDSDAAGTLKRLDERGEDRFTYTGFEKANVVAGSAVSGTWASDLVLTDGGAFADFAEYLRPQTILGKFGQGNIPSLRRIPFDTALGISTASGSGYWVGEGKPKPLTSFNFDKTTLAPLKCANIVVLTEDLLRRASTSAETLVRDEMANALVALMDDSFIDPTNAGSAGVEPASIANGAISIAASGTGDADDVRQDIRNLLQVFINNNMEGSTPVLVMRTGTALGAAFQVNALGQAEFPNITMNGGTILQIPVITSQTVPSGVVVAVQPSEIYYADEGGFMVDVSREASLQMLDNPTNDTVTPTATQMVSLWQTNSVGFRCERILNWARRRSNAAVYLTGAAWGGATNT